MSNDLARRYYISAAAPARAASPEAEGRMRVGPGGKEPGTKNPTHVLQ